MGYQVVTKNQLTSNYFDSIYLQSQNIHRFFFKLFPLQLIKQFYFMQINKVEQYQSSEYFDKSISMPVLKKQGRSSRQSNRFEIRPQFQARVQKKSHEKHQKSSKTQQMDMICNTTCFDPDFEVQFDELHAKNQKLKKLKTKKIFKKKLNQLNASMALSLLSQKSENLADQDIDWALLNKEKQVIDYYQQQKEKNGKNQNQKPEKRRLLPIKKRGRPHKVFTGQQEENKQENKNKLIKKNKGKVLLRMKLGEQNQINSINPFLRDCYQSVVQSNKFFNRFEEIIQESEQRKKKPNITQFLEFANCQNSSKKTVCLASVINNFSLPLDEGNQSNVCLIKEILEVYTLPQFQKIADQYILADGLYKLKMSKVCIDNVQAYDNIEDPQKLLRAQASEKVFKLITYLKKGILRQQIDFQISQQFRVSRNKVKKIYLVKKTKKQASPEMVAEQINLDQTKEKNKQISCFGIGFEDSLFFQELSWGQFGQYLNKKVHMDNENL